MLGDLRRHAGDRRAQHGVIEVALAPGRARRRPARKAGYFSIGRSGSPSSWLRMLSLLLLELFELRLRRHQRGQRIVDVDLRAGAIGEQRVLAVDVALLEVDGLARERDAAARVDARLVFRLAKSVRTLARRASACVHRDAERLGIDLEQRVARA